MKSNIYTKILVLAAMLLGAPPAQSQTQLPAPRFPNSPTSSAECDAVSRQWSDISSEIHQRHQICLDSQACKKSGSNYRGVCSCGACHNLHVVMDRYSSGDLAQYRRAAEKQCRQQAASYQEEQRRQRQVYEDSQRRAREQQAAMDQQARQQQAFQEQQLRQQQAMQEQQRRQQQAQYEQQQREALAEQQRRQQLAQQQLQQQQALSGQQQQAYAEQQRRQQQQQALEEQRQQAALAEQQRRQQQLAQQQPQSQPQPQRPAPSVALAAPQAVAPAPAVPSTSAQQIRSSIERAAAGYEAAMQRNITVGDTALSVGGLKDTLVSLTTTFLSHLEPTSLLRGIGRGAGSVATNPVLELVGPFMDPENARNIYGAVEAARRQAREGTMNVNSARQLREVMEEIDRQGRGQ